MKVRVNCTVNEQGVVDSSRKHWIFPTKIAISKLYHMTECGVFLCNSMYYKKRKSHPGLLICSVKHGDFFLYYKDKHYFLSKGDSFLIDTTEPHYYHAGDTLEFDFISFDGKDARDLCHYIMDNISIKFSGKKAKDVSKQITEIYNYFVETKDDLLSESFISLSLYRIFMTLLNEETAFEDNSYDPVNLAIEYIREHYDLPLTVGELAKQVGLSKYYFARMFKEKTGYSPMEFIISTRMDIAKSLLVNCNFSIQEIAYKIGYTNHRSFLNVFAKNFGITPSQYRSSITPE